MPNTQIDLASSVAGILAIANGGNGSATAFAGLASASGYQKHSSGIIIQWGTTPFNGSGSAAITFPITFPTGFLFVNASIARGSTLSGYLMSTQIGSTSASGATVIGNYTTGGGASVLNLSSNESAAWIAIGY